MARYHITFAVTLLIVSPAATAWGQTADWFVDAPSPHSVVFEDLDVDRILRAQDSPFDEPLVTDRPDFTEASSTVGRSVIQLETGYTYSYDDDDELGAITHGHSGPEMLLRYGINEWIELRLVWNYLWESVNENGLRSRADGAEDLVFGTKIQLTNPNGWMPESAVILDMSAPTGGRSFSNHHVETGVNFLYSWDLTEDFSLAGSTGHGTATDQVPGFDRHNVFHQSISLGAGLTERLGSYIEYFGLYSHGREDTRPENYIDGGFTFLLDDNNQLDIRAGKGLNEAADDFFGGVGMSFRR